MYRYMGWVGLGLGIIWIAVLILSTSDGGDLIYGADLDRFPLVQATTWIWGAIASAFVLNALVQRHATGDDQYYASVGIAIASLIIWIVIIFVSFVVPLFTFNFGDSAVIIPLGKVLAPAAGVTATRDRGPVRSRAHGRCGIGGPSRSLPIDQLADLPDAIVSVRNRSIKSSVS